MLPALLAVAAGMVPFGGAASAAPAAAPLRASAAGPAVTGPEAYSLLTSRGALVGYGGAFSANVGSPASPVVG
ncbi:MAG: hypothetical protein ACRDZY_13680, partial [Acidimicrobiales bacterium]